MFQGDFKSNLYKDIWPYSKNIDLKVPYPKEGTLW